MPPKPTPSIPPPKPQVVSSVVKAAAAAYKATGGVSGSVPGVAGSTSGTAGGGTTGSGGGSGNNNNGPKQPPKKKKTIAKAKRPGGSVAVVISKDDTLHPTKIGGVMKNKSSIGGSGGGGASTSAADKVHFSSQKLAQQKISKPSFSKPSTSTGGAGSSAGGGSLGNNNPAASIAQLQQFKIEKAQIARKELAEMDAIERAFREDAVVWNGPKNVVFPKRYHKKGTEDNVDNSGGDGDEKMEDTDKRSNEKKKSSIENPYMAYYGSQSQGWMYGEGFAGIGGRSWMEVTSKSNNTEEKKGGATPTMPGADDTTTANKPTHQNSDATGSFLVDDVSIIENSLKSNGLSRHDLTPKAYACLLEQARRYALELLANAQDYAVHASRSTIPALLPADLLLAAEMQEEGEGGNSGGMHGVASTLPTPQEISDLASEVNRAPLPPIPSSGCYDGVALPPAEEQLTARTFDVVNGARVAQRMMRGGDLPLVVADILNSASGGGGAGNTGKKGGKDGASADAGSKNATSGASKRKTTVGSYGAGKGRQIAVHLKGSKSSSDAGKKAGGATAGSLTTASGKATSGTKSGLKKGQKRTLTEL